MEVINRKKFLFHFRWLFNCKLVPCNLENSDTAAKYSAEDTFAVCLGNLLRDETRHLRPVLPEGVTARLKGCKMPASDLRSLSLIDRNKDRSVWQDVILKYTEVDQSVQVGTKKYTQHEISGQIKANVAEARSEIR